MGADHYCAVDGDLHGIAKWKSLPSFGHLIYPDFGILRLTVCSALSCYNIF